MKEYTEAVEAKGRPDAAVAAEALATYKKRNDSAVVDLCSGQFRSTVVCPDCGLVSKTFDPYFSVSLPLAKESGAAVALQVMVVPLGARRTAVTVSVPRAAPVAALVAAAAAAAGIGDARRFVAAELHQM